MISTLHFAPDLTLALTSEPLECIECREMHCCFVDRDGRTRCLECDAEFVAREIARLQTRAKGSGGGIMPEPSFIARPHFVTRLSPEQIIARAEARHDAWRRWALFWMVIGALTGCGLTLLVIELWST